MKLLGAYKNGNYNVTIFDNGTKIRETKEDEFVSEFPECIDIKITNYCDRNCPYCHENSSTKGKHGILSRNFILTLKPYTELAIGGGNPLSHPNLIPFLKLLKERKIIANMTVNQTHFEEYQEQIHYLLEEKLIYGLGVSITHINENLIGELQQYPNIVLHVINGIIKVEELEKLYDKNLKILILGYKQFRRGKEYYSKEVETRKQELFDNLKLITSKFKVVSFDNLALKQLQVKRLMTEEEWNEFYMGDDGNFTMYIDLVNQKFAKSSISNKRYKLLDDIEDMFKIVKGETNE